MLYEYIHEDGTTMRQRTEDDDGFGVFCEVWGGVTGYRCSWLKSNGVLQVFATRDAAERRAEALRDAMNGNPHRVAMFAYTVKPIRVSTGRQ